MLSPSVPPFDQPTLAHLQSKVDQQLTSCDNLGVPVAICGSGTFWEPTNGLCEIIMPPPQPPPPPFPLPFTPPPSPSPSPPPSPVRQNTTCDVAQACNPARHRFDPATGFCVDYDPAECYRNDNGTVYIMCQAGLYGDVSSYPLDRDQSYFSSLSPTVTRVVVGPLVHTIPKKAFWKLNSLTSVDLGAVVTVDEEAFYGCSNLLDIHLPNTTVNVYDFAFAGCSSARSVVMGHRVRVVGKAAFAGRRNSYTGWPNWQGTTLQSVAKMPTLPPSLVDIGDHAFLSFTSATGVLDIPSSVTSIGTGAFSGAESISKIVLRANITHLNESVFSSAYRVSSLSIASALSSIGRKVFDRLGNSLSAGMANVSLSLSNMGTNAFYHANMHDVIIVGNVTESTFKEATVQNLTVIGDIVGEDAFSYSHITHLTIYGSISSELTYYKRSADITNCSVISNGISSDCPLDGI